MRSRFHFLLPLVLSALAAPLLAAEPPQAPYIRCVQNELAALGAAVPVTGRLNRATKTAAQTMQKRFASSAHMALLPKLSEIPAASWCRELASLKPELRKFMPSASAPLFMSSGGPGSVQTAVVRESFQSVERFFQARYNLQLASRVDVAGADSGAELTKLAIALQRGRGVSYGGMSRSVGRNCRTPSIYFSGQAYRDQLLICWKREAKFDQAWRRKVGPKIGAIMAHEYMHHIQYELTNSKVWRNNYRSQSRMGPAWMVEGGAEVAEYEWKIARGGYRRLSLAELMKPASKSAKSLRTMLENRSVKGLEQYLTARYAVYLLTKRYGEQAVLNYWRHVGQGKSWEAAFRAAFGQSISSFYSEFEVMRRDTQRSASYMAGG